MPNKLSTYGQVTLLAFSALGLTSNSAWAEKDVDYINALKSEAKATDMTDKKIASENRPEPAAAPSQSLDMKALTQRVSKDLQRILATNNKAVSAEANVQDNIEKMVSSSLEDGHKMNDIRSAVSGAMASLKGQPKHSLEAKKVESVSNALSQIIGKKNDKITGNPGKNYIRSLNPQLAKTSTKNNTLNPDARTVTIMQGESLYKVSMRLYGVGDYYMALYEANRDSINNPDDIQVGQVLRVPEQP